MKRTLYLASGISVLFTTLAFGHIMIHNTTHIMSHHDASPVFLIVHTILAVAFGVLSLIGAYFLLTGWRRQSSN
ncbi:MAG TPA: hypothetical protein VN943_04180 [Candidatus Acidoferrum sp.]|nr:hypothetical protein [Candidatus Acidoferrum sp.]